MGDKYQGKFVKYQARSSEMSWVFPIINFKLGQAFLSKNKDSNQIYLNYIFK